MREIKDIFYNKNDNILQSLDVYLPNNDEFNVFVYFHGGGFKSGDKSDPQKFIEFLIAKGIAVANANYRMYPDAKYPDFVEDAASAVSWVYKNIHNYGKIKGIYVGGSSAGGYLSQMLCFDRSWLEKHNICPMDITGFIHDAGQPTCHFSVLEERKIDSRRVIIDDTSSLYHIGKDENYPPMLIIVSDNDMENRFEQTQLLISTLKHFGHTKNIEYIVMNGTHCSYVGAVNENGESVFGKIISDFICK